MWQPWWPATVRTSRKIPGWRHHVPAPEKSIIYSGWPLTLIPEGAISAGNPAAGHINIKGANHHEEKLASLCLVLVLCLRLTFPALAITVTSHDITIDLNGHTLTSDPEFPAFEVQSGYTLTIVDTSAPRLASWSPAPASPWM